MSVNVAFNRLFSINQSILPFKNTVQQNWQEYSVTRWKNAFFYFIQAIWCEQKLLEIMSLKQLSHRKHKQCKKVVNVKSQNNWYICTNVAMSTCHKARDGTLIGGGGGGGGWCIFIYSFLASDFYWKWFGFLKKSAPISILAPHPAY